MNYQELSDREQLHSFLLGSQDCFDRLVEKYEGFIYSLSVHLSESLSDSEAILTDVFLRMLREAKTLSQMDCIRLDLVRFALESTRELSGKNAIDDISTLSEISVQNICKSEDQAQTLERVMRKLPFEYRVVMVLRDILELEIQEICEATSLPEQEVQMRLHRSRLMARRGLRREARSIRANNLHAEGNSVPKTDVSLERL